MKDASEHRTNGLKNLNFLNTVIAHEGSMDAWTTFRKSFAIHNLLRTRAGILSIPIWIQCESFTFQVARKIRIANSDGPSKNSNIIDVFTTAIWSWRKLTISQFAWTWDIVLHVVILIFKFYTNTEWCSETRTVFWRIDSSTVAWLLQYFLCSFIRWLDVPLCSRAPITPARHPNNNVIKLDWNCISNGRRIVGYFVAYCTARTIRSEMDGIVANSMANCIKSETHSKC